MTHLTGSSSSSSSMIQAAYLSMGTSAQRDDSSSLFWHLVQPAPKVIFRREACRQLFCEAVMFVSWLLAHMEPCTIFYTLIIWCLQKLQHQVYIISCYNPRTASTFRMNFKYVFFKPMRSWFVYLHKSFDLNFYGWHEIKINPIYFLMHSIACCWISCQRFIHIYCKRKREVMIYPLSENKLTRSNTV